jgi:hypothetical protein
MRKNNLKKRSQIIRKCKNSIKKRLKKKSYKDQPKPIMTGTNIHYEMGDKTRGNRSPPLEILTENQYRIHSADACQLAQLIRIGWGTGSL